ncbi:hypothetical protein OIU84_029683 [Salix udensis]|uniref:Major facilitator superfamily (MFS) profile domain-containing protein n=1 Tax=Salix udensis TaxID=889485 RepID=A0AAD6K9T8_9ROSI|nr:hypothetical protein OIU84_029683 [Salix udensis]
MAGGVFVGPSTGGSYEGRVTTFVIITCLVAAMGGLIFGYDIGISGGVTSMDSFLEKFFPSVYRKEKEDHHESMYCKFDSHLLQLFTSSLYLSALRCLSSVVYCLVLASALLTSLFRFIYRRWHRQKLEEHLTLAFQMAITIGILAANLINYGTSKIKEGYGWRISLAVAAVPAIMMIVGSFFLPDTPNSILERGHPEKAKKMLQKIRGTNNVEAEFQDLVAANDNAKKVEHPWKNILQPRYRPQLVICVLIPFFQQLTGINVINFLCPYSL